MTNNIRFNQSRHWSNGKNELNPAGISEDDAVKGKVAGNKGRTCKLVT